MSESSTTKNTKVVADHLNLLSYINDLKTRNKMRLKPIDVAKLHGYKECVDYLATFEACLSLAEENIALETELLHYVAELAELEKCFNELLQVTKSERIQTQGSYFGSVVESIERKWKRCKSKSLGSHGTPNQSPLRLFQSHFSRILTDDVLSELSSPPSTIHSTNRPSRDSNPSYHYNPFSSNYQTSPHHQPNNQTNPHHQFRTVNNRFTNNLTHYSGTGRNNIDKSFHNNGCPSTCSDLFMELSNGHYSLSSVDADYAVPFKIRTGNNNKKNIVKKGENTVNLGRRGSKQQRSQLDVLPGSYPESSSLFESCKRNQSIRDTNPGYCGEIDLDLDFDLDLDLDLDEEGDELSGYSSLKLRPPTKSLFCGRKDSHPPADRVDDSSKASKESPKGSIETTEILSDPESKVSEGRESSVNDSISNKENDSCPGETDSSSRKRGFLHKFSLRKWTSSSASKPKKSYSKETLLRSIERDVREGEEDGNRTKEPSSDQECISKSFPIKSQRSLSKNSDEKHDNWWLRHNSHHMKNKMANDDYVSISDRSVGGQSFLKLATSTVSIVNNFDNKIITTSPFDRKEDSLQTINQIDSAPIISANIYAINDDKKNKHNKKNQATCSESSGNSPMPKHAVDFCPSNIDKPRSVIIESEAVPHYQNFICAIKSSSSFPSEALIRKESANDRQLPQSHYGTNVDTIDGPVPENYSIKLPSLTNPDPKESKLLNDLCFAKPTSAADVNDCYNENDTGKVTSSIHDLSSGQLLDSSSLVSINSSPEALVTSQGVPILSNSVYGVKHVKKAKIKELSPLNLEQVTPTPSNIPNPSLTKFLDNRKMMFEKGPGNKSTNRGLRRRRVGNRAWYDVSDDEDGLVPQKFNPEKILEGKGNLDC